MPAFGVRCGSNKGVSSCKPSIMFDRYNQAFDGMRGAVAGGFLGNRVGFVQPKM